VNTITLTPEQHGKLAQEIVEMAASVAPSLNEATRTAQVRIVLDDAGAAAMLRAGMFARVAVSVPAKGDAVLAVPEGAVLTVEGGPAVFVAVEGEPGAFQKRAVVVGAVAGGWLPVLSGLKEGDKVVVGGAFILKAELAKGIMEGKTCTGH
jgi:cobalt-zinc-cadmium efflux system membrane fusion protein